MIFNIGHLLCIVNVSMAGSGSKMEPVYFIQSSGRLLWVADTSESDAEPLISTTVYLSSHLDLDRLTKIRANGGCITRCTFKFIERVL